MKYLKYNGKDLDDIITSITSRPIFWELKRSAIRNFETNVHHIIFCGYLTNKSIGIALSQKINHIIAINKFNNDNFLSLSENGIELMYKNDIFLITLGVNWIFNTTFGMKMVNKIITNADASLWKSSFSVAHVFIGLEDPLSLNLIFARLRNSVLYLPPKLEIETSSVNNILLISKEIDKKDIIDLPEVIITFELTSSIIRWCYTHGIVLVFINADVFYSEIARDMSYIVSKTTNIQTTFQTHLDYKLYLM